MIEILDGFELTTRDGNNRGAGPELAALATRPFPIGRKETELWRHTTTFLETGEPFVLMDAEPQKREAAYRNIVSELARLFSHAADELAARIDLAPASIIDVGCGSGVWSLALAKSVPGARVTGVDLPAVLKNFLTRAESLGLGDRVDAIEGDMHTVGLPAANWDLLVIANVLRLEPADSARNLVQRLGAVVRPGGSVLVVDALAGGTPEKDRARAIYALHLALRTSSGRVHSQDEIIAWLAGAGFAEPVPIEVTSQYASMGAVGALLARKS